MTLQGKWRIVEMPDFEAGYLNMMGPAYIAFDDTGGEFAFGCVTGSFPGAADGDAVTFDWDGNDEMDEACGDGWAERQREGLHRCARNCGARPRGRKTRRFRARADLE